ncbi:hypothetical protein TIFTF001_029378 [Ficus carica]|uniref:Uncharacterized protein n=1 Tax=Ficus carica TaxID=3494 RepID=A0AA88DRQ0_FICCA|nr:hypothetical protein TIFTF001_029378 [Ficus carica]
MRIVAVVDLAKLAADHLHASLSGVVVMVRSLSNSKAAPLSLPTHLQRISPQSRVHRSD